MNATQYGQQPEEEKKRLKELRSYNILDSLSEADYEDITKLASIICDVPIALISLVDSDRQWFKSHRGLDIDETQRQYSFCSHAILNPEEDFIIEDSRLDNRFKDNPYVTGNPNIVFYAGIPLVSNNGYGLGTFCIIDSKPRILSEEQLNALHILSRQVMNLLELRKSNMELGIRKELLEIKTNNLDKIIAERIAEIERQNIQLENMNKELKSFTYISSHDLQEPLRKINTFITLIAEREFDRLSDTGKEYFLKIGKSSSRMSVLIDDLLAYSRTTNSARTYDTISLRDVVTDVVHDLNEEIEHQDAKVEVLNTAEFEAIAFQFRQVIYNLLSNSLKFSRPGIPPHITINYGITTGEALHTNYLIPQQQYHVIIFKDNGIGFDNRYKDKIFELFQRLQTKGLQPGTGIGLAIVKKIVDNHKGHIEAQSAPNEGTQFTILLPV